MTTQAAELTVLPSQMEFAVEYPSGRQQRCYNEHEARWLATLTDGKVVAREIHRTTTGWAEVSD